MSMVVFGFGASPEFGEGPEFLRLVQQADRDGLDLFSLADHPYLGGRLDAYATIGFTLGTTGAIAALANVTNLPTRPAPMLARTVTSLSALSGGRVVLGMGAGGRLNRVTEMGAPRLTPGAAVEAMEEAVLLIRRMAGGGPPVTHHGKHYEVDRAEPAPVLAPPVWTGSVGPKSLAATGRVADGWIPGHAADWLSPRYRESRPIIDQAAVSAGRAPRDIADIFNLTEGITDQPLPATRDADGRWAGGSVDQWVDELTGAVLDHAAAGFILFSPAGGTADPTTLRRWAAEVAPAVRSRVGR
jgi:alkanesulfonate monooxygenase SsuD/methylene tetrahydromethanopterin reductase-like flavin-dependent oxidoreductase (luciferase family)